MNITSLVRTFESVDHVKTAAVAPGVGSDKKESTSNHYIQSSSIIDKSTAKTTNANEANSIPVQKPRLSSSSSSSTPMTTRSDSQRKRTPKAETMLKMQAESLERKKEKEILNGQKKADGTIKDRNKRPNKADSDKCDFVMEPRLSKGNVHFVEQYKYPNITASQNHWPVHDSYYQPVTITADEHPSVPRKRMKYNADTSPMDIENTVMYDANYWKLESGKLIRHQSLSNNTDKAVFGDYRYIQSPDHMNTSLRIHKQFVLPKVKSSNPSQEAEKEEMTRGQRFRRRQPKATKFRVNGIPIGLNHQVAILPVAGTAKSDDSNEFILRQIWDPVSADASFQSDDSLEKLLANKYESNQTTLLMEAIHTADYNAQDAVKSFVKLHEERDYSVQLTPQQDEIFTKLCRSGIIGKKKDFKAAAAAIGCRKEAVIVNYYRWKTRCRGEYYEQKGERKKEPTECAVCDDGGRLLVCELCRHAYHLKCLDPPMKDIPKGDWYCPRCNQLSPCQLRRLTAGPQNEAQPHSTNARKPAPNATRCLAQDLAMSSSKLIDQNDSFHQGQQEVECASCVAGNNLPAMSSAIADPSFSTPISDSASRAETEGSAEDPVLGTPPPTDRSDDSTSSVDRKDTEVISIASSSDSAVKDAQDSIDALRGNRPSTILASSAGRLVHETVSSSKNRPSKQYYTVDCPVTKEGKLFIGIEREQTGSMIVFSGYQRGKDNEIGPAEKQQTFWCEGDIFVEVDGVECFGKSIKDFIAMVQRPHPSKQTVHLKMLHDPDFICLRSSEKLANEPSKETINTVEMQQHTQ